jgi:hypothetical protein
MRLSDAGLRQHPTKLFYPDHRPTPWLAEDAPRDRSNRLLDALQRVELVLTIKVIQQEIIIPTAGPLAGNYAGAAKGRPQEAIFKRSGRKDNPSLGQFPGRHLKLKVHVWTTIVPLLVTEAVERRITTRNSRHERNHRRYICRDRAGGLELNRERTHVPSND